MAKNTKNQLPGIAFEKNEHLVLVIKPTKLIPVGFWAGAFLCSALLIAASIIVNGGNALIVNLDATSRSFFMLVILVVLGTIWIATLISTHVYSGNCLYVTNKRLIQNVVTSLFASSTNVIDLIAVEDVSFKQSGLFEHLFSIGTLRMSTIGSETTYTFKNVDTPTDELETITHLVHVEKGETSDAACPNEKSSNEVSSTTIEPISAPHDTVVSTSNSSVYSDTTNPSATTNNSTSSNSMNTNQAGFDTSSSTFNSPKFQ